MAPVLKKIQLKLFCAAKKCTFLIYHILEEVKSLTMFPTIISFFRHLLIVDLIMAVSSLNQYLWDKLKRDKGQLFSGLLNTRSFFFHR